MPENDNLQNADGTEKVSSVEQTTESSITTDLEHSHDNASDNNDTPQTTEASVEDSPQPQASESTPKNHVDEIDAANAEDAEDSDNADRHAIEEKDYHAMSIEQLADELEHLLKHRKIQTIKSHVDEIRTEFNAKFSEKLDEKKEEFLADGGDEIDFYFTSPVKKRFNSIYAEYKKNLGEYYKNLETTHKANLEKRLQIIEDIKGLLNVEENINTTYKHFKELQEQWRNAGPIPREKYNDTWNTYHHHVEIFYDFLHLNRDLRDMDFKHNLEQKLKIIERAEALANEDNANKAFRELQALHKMWKEDLGPVDREHREEIWERFSNATKAIHDKRQAYLADIDKIHEANLEKKEDIIAKIASIAQDPTSTHQAWQKKIQKTEELRQEFFKAGKVPNKDNEPTWAKFKEAVRSFNRKKNNFYKHLKKDQYDNLQKKLELVKIAEENKDNKDFDATTPLMKKIQLDWKAIGHVPRKESDKIWKRFKTACNHYFDQLHAERKSENQELFDAFEKKTKLLDTLKELKLSGNPETDIETIKQNIDAWKAIGQVPQNKRFIEGKFNRVLDGLFGNLKMSKSEIELIKFENKLEHLAQPDDTRLLDHEHNFIRKKIDELRSNVNQLENNLQFFSNVDESNPLVKDVMKNIQKHRDELSTWEEKLKKLRELY